MLQLGVELDLLEVDGAGEEHVHELTVGRPRAQLLTKHSHYLMMHKMNFHGPTQLLTKFDLYF